MLKRILKHFFERFCHWEESFKEIQLFNPAKSCKIKHSFPDSRLLESKVIFLKRGNQKYWHLVQVRSSTINNNEFSTLLLRIIYYQYRYNTALNPKYTITFKPSKWKIFARKACIGHLNTPWYSHLFYRNICFTLLFSTLRFRTK